MIRFEKELSEMQDKYEWIKQIIAMYKFPIDGVKRAEEKDKERKEDNIIYCLFRT